MHACNKLKGKKMTHGKQDFDTNSKSPSAKSETDIQIVMKQNSVSSVTLKATVIKALCQPDRKWLKLQHYVCLINKNNESCLKPLVTQPFENDVFDVFFHHKKLSFPVARE